MARTHGLDKRLQEQKATAMTSTQKLPKHHSFSSSTQDSIVTPSGKGGGATPAPYKSGASVTKGSKPAPGAGGVSVASDSKSMGQSMKKGKC